MQMLIKYDKKLEFLIIKLSKKVYTVFTNIFVCLTKVFFQMSKIGAELPEFLGVLSLPGSKKSLLTVFFLYVVKI